MNPITIVVPAYGHVSSFIECIESVIDYGDLNVNSLLIVNDSGPEASEIEEASLRLIKGISNAQYERNNSNLGFVRTCNRAALEIDNTQNDILLLNSDAKLTKNALRELSYVLHSSEKHGAACPRSSNAGLSTIPYYPHDKKEKEEEYSFELHSKLKKSLPRQTIIPVAVGFCLLIKRQLIVNHGLFDTVFSPGYDEENDFCMRINEIGYSSVMANHSFVHHLGSKSFEEKKRNKLQKSHHKILVKRYPYYERTIRNYLDFRMDAADVFSDFIFPSKVNRPKILLDASSMGPVHNGSSRVALSVFEAFALKAKENYSLAEYTIRAPQQSIKFFNLEKFGFATTAKEEPDEHIFDLGVAITPIWHVEQLHYFNFACSRWILTHFDVIALRTHELLDSEHVRRKVVLDSIRFADKVISISNYSSQDLLEFFEENSDQISQTEIVTNTLGIPKNLSQPLSIEDIHKFEDGSILVVGNHFKHKQVLNTLLELAQTGKKILVLGGDESHKISPNIEVFSSGYFSDDQISELYKRASCVVFPSVYEGYGIPIAEAQLHHKPVVLFDSAISREVVADLGFEDGAFFFSRFADLPKIIDSTSKSLPVKSQSNRNLENFANELVNLSLETITKPKNVSNLRHRVEYFRSILAYEEGALDSINVRLNRRAYKTVDNLLNFVAAPATSVAKLFKKQQSVTSMRTMNSKVYE